MAETTPKKPKKQPRERCRHRYNTELVRDLRFCMRCHAVALGDGNFVSPGTPEATADLVIRYLKRPITINKQPADTVVEKPEPTSEEESE